MTLVKKILAVMGKVQYLKKDDAVKFGATSYKAMSEEKVTSIMHEALVENGIIVYPVAQRWQRDGTITHVDVTYRIVNADDETDFIEVVSCGDGADTQDKGSGKAMTYAYKYMFLRTFCIPTGDDPDKITSAQLDAEAAERDAAKKATECKDKTAALLDTPGVVCKCESCGGTIERMKKKNGSYMEVSEVIDLSRKRYGGAVLCGNCMRKQEG